MDVIILATVVHGMVLAADSEWLLGGGSSGLLHELRGLYRARRFQEAIVLFLVAIGDTHRGHAIERAMEGAGGE